MRIEYAAAPNRSIIFAIEARMRGSGRVRAEIDILTREPWGIIAAAVA